MTSTDPGTFCKPRDIKSEKPQKNLLYRITKGPYLGLICTFLGCIFLNLGSVVVKRMVSASPEQLVLIRNFGTLVWSLPIAVFSGENILGPKSYRIRLTVNGVLTAIILYLSFVAYRLLPLGDAVVIISTTPAFVVIAARLFLKEPCGLVVGCTLVLTFIGIVLSVRLPELIFNRDGLRFTTEYMTGMASAVATVFCLSGCYIAIRTLKDVHCTLVQIYASFIGIVGGCCLMPVLGVYELPHCGWDPLLMLCVAVCGFTSQTLITLGIQSEAVGIVSIVRFSLNIVIGLLFQVVFFSDYPDVYNYCGALIIMVAVSAIGLKKFVQLQPESSIWRQKLKFMLL